MLFSQVRVNFGLANQKLEKLRCLCMHDPLSLKIQPLLLLEVCDMLPLLPLGRGYYGLLIDSNRIALTIWMRLNSSLHVNFRVRPTLSVTGEEGREGKSIFDNGIIWQ